MVCLTLNFLFDNIIKYNLEREEKDKLFETKVNELKSIFEKQSLDKLKGLFFNINEPKSKVKLEDNEEQIESDRVVGTEKERG